MQCRHNDVLRLVSVFDGHIKATRYVKLRVNIKKSLKLVEFSWVIFECGKCLFPKLTNGLKLLVSWGWALKKYKKRAKLSNLTKTAFNNWFITEKHGNSKVGTVAFTYVRNDVKNGHIWKSVDIIYLLMHVRFNFWLKGATKIIVFNLSPFLSSVYFLSAFIVAANRLHASRPPNHFTSPLLRGSNGKSTVERC
jgi:hypothetical protein